MSWLGSVGRFRRDVAIDELGGARMAQSGVLVGVLVEPTLGWPVVGTLGMGSKDSGGGKGKCDVAEFEPQLPNLATAVQLILITYLITIPPDSVPVHSGDHSGLNSGMAPFRRNMYPPEWQIWLDPLPNFIPPDSTGIRRNDRNPAGIYGA